MCRCVLVLGVEAPKKSTDANIFGHVVDRDTHEHIPYATIAVTGTAFGTTTDASGHYFLKNLPEGALTLEVRALGYASQTQQVTLRRGQTAELNFEVVQSGISMDEVVVSASRSARLRREAPALVSVLDAALFEKTNASCLAQGLSFQPGVRVEDDCQNCGFTQVRINGLDGHYSQILVDSHPVFSALTGVYGLEQIPANMIERVEVMRGGGSALYGSSAIGGTINIITRDPLRNSAQASHTLTALGGSGSYDNVTSLNASLVTDSGKAGLYVFGQNRHRSGYDHDGDGFTEIPVLQSISAGLRSFLRTGSYSRLTMQYNGVQEYVNSTTGLKFVVGHPVHEFFLNRYAGVNPANGDALWYTKDGELTTEFNESDKVMTGKTFDSPWAGGFGTTFAWKGLSLSAQFSWMADRWVMNNDRFFEESNGLYSTYNQSRRLLYDRWKKPGDITDIPRYGVTAQLDDRFLESSSFLRLKNLTLAYALPQPLLKKTNFFTSARVYLQGQNLLTFTGFTGLDPEMSSNIYRAQYPASRQFTLGIEVSF